MNRSRKGALPQPQDYAPIEPLTYEVSNNDYITLLGFDFYKPTLLRDFLESLPFMLLIVLCLFCGAWG